MKFKKVFSIAASLLLLGSLTSSALAQTRSAKPSDEAVRAQNAASVLAEIMEAPDQGIPEALLAKAQGIAVIPHVVKGAFGFGGRYGKGLIAQRNADGGWGTPLFVQISGGSFGLQLGVEATDVIMVFTNREGVNSLLRSKLKIGADASATAGPVGRKAEAGTDILLNSAIYSYSRAKGLFAGISLDGAVIQLDNGANKKVYGQNVTSADRMTGALLARARPTVQPFVLALDKYAQLR